MGGPSPWVVSVLGDGGHGLGSLPPTTGTHVTLRERPFCRWGSHQSKAGMCYTHKGNRAPQLDGHAAIKTDKQEAHIGHQGSKRTGRAGLH